MGHFYPNLGQTLVPFALEIMSMVSEILHVDGHCKKQSSK